jgi:ferric-dicitrate binding protein FerR (iron transport regulator)
VTIRFADANLRQKRVVGRVRLDAPQAQLEALAMVHGFAVERHGDVIVLR